MLSMVARSEWWSIPPCAVSESGCGRIMGGWWCYNADHGGKQGPFCEHHAKLLTPIAYHIGDRRDVKVFRPSFHSVPFWASMCSLEIECASILIKTPSAWTWQLRPQDLHLQQTIPHCLCRLMVKLHLHPIENDEVLISETVCDSELFNSLSVL